MFSYSVIDGAKIKQYRKIVAVGLAFLLVFSYMLAVVPVTAFQAPDRTVGAYAATSPKVLGLGQTLTVNLMLWPCKEDPIFHTWARDTTSVRGYSAEQQQEELLKYYRLVGYQGIEVTFVRPDGTKDTFKPIDVSLQNLGINEPGLMSLMGTTLFYYKPNMVGNWSCYFTFPGETVSNEAYSTFNDTVYYKPAKSDISYFTVVEDEVLGGLLNGYPWSPLPTNYWERPISVNNREWSAIGGPWLRAGYDSLNSRYNPYSTAPESSHIVWKIRTYFGGIAGGDWGSWGYNARVISAGAPMIVDSLVFVNEADSGYFNCYDLYSGELKYRSEGAVSFLYTYRPQYQTLAQDEGVAGAIQPVIVDTSTSGQWKLRSTWNNGKILRTITNVPSGLSTIWTDIDTVVYAYQRANWNTTKHMQWEQYNVLKWDMAKVTGNNWMTGVVWNTTVRQGSEFVPGDSGRSGFLRFDGANTVVLCSQMENRWIAYDMTTGNVTWKRETDWVSTNLFTAGPNGPIVAWDAAIHSYRAIDPKTGADLWTSDPIGTGDWKGMPLYYQYNFALGNMYVVGFDGYVYSISLATGKLNWKTYLSGDSSEMVFNTLAFGANSNNAGADGKLYFASGTMYANQPLSRFHKIHCVDATTGEVIWSMPFTGGQTGMAIAGGYLLAPSEDGTLYAFNKGKTETSVSVQNNVIAKGATALITGNVLDQSPAQAGTPAVADESMSEWMDYLHMQNATLINSPPTPKGVDVILTATGPDGKTIDIGTTTTTGDGNFALAWTPPSEGLYWIRASFVGSNSYWPSKAETALTVTAASGAVEPSVTPEPSTPSQSPSAPASTTSPVTPTLPVQSPTPAAPGSETSMPLTTYIAVAAAAIIAVVVAAALLLKRRVK